MMYKSVFALNGNDNVFTGYTNGNLWNGWQVPCFEKNEAIRIMQDFNTHMPDHPINYDKAHDCFFAQTDYDDIDVWEGFDVETEDGIKHCYSIGECAMLWEKRKEC